MITALLMENCAPGSLPIFDIHPEYSRTYWVLEHGEWVEHLTRSPRVILQQDIDTNLEEFAEMVPLWVDEADRLSEVGTLLFFTQCVARLEWGDSLIIAAAGLLPFHCPNGMQLDRNGMWDLNDPTRLILNFTGHMNTLDPVQLEELRRRAAANRHERLRNLREEQAREQLRRDLANGRARRLLGEFLTPAQHEELVTRSHIHVKGQDGKTYRICAATHQNVFEVEGDRPVTQFCVVPRDPSLPLYDIMLAQKLMLETNIEGFMALANRWNLTQGERQRVPQPVVVRDVA